MKDQHIINDITGISMEKLHEMADVSTVIGDPIVIDDDTKIIPISRVSFGYASGGSDIPNKNDKEMFGGGAGGGCSINPVAFLVIQNGDTKLLQLSDNPEKNALVNMIPGVADVISSLFSKKKSKKSKKTEVDLSDIEESL